ncbi:hypothetical protein QBC43DRAFT_301288 [Cladorrhinum sp. PSN259]|nr:hypothetical protein QBC43DRAFT_301288 [Cladorrhinum sp. PSN259]
MTATTATPKYTDSPLSLIPTPKFQTGKDDPFTIEASHMALSHNSTPEKPIDILGIANASGKKQVNMTLLFNTLPVFFLNMETVEFEGGMWHGAFPPLKGLARSVMLKAVPMWHSGPWRFVSCTPEGTVKHLAV